MARRRSGSRYLFAAGIAAVFLSAAPLLAPSTAVAWSGSSNTGTLPSTRDYINTNTWMSGDLNWCCPWSNTFNWQSSTNLEGSYPWNPYWESDSQQMTTNGVGVSISCCDGPSVGFNPSSNSVIYSLSRYNAWNVSQVGYHEQWSAFAFFNVTSNDTSNVRPWSWSGSYYNHAYATKWW